MTPKTITTTTAMRKMSQYSRPHSIAKAPFQFRPAGLCIRGLVSNRRAGLLAETARQQAAQPIAERPCIRRGLAVEHARLIEQEVRVILLESQVVFAQRRECHDDRVARVDFQDRL